MPQSYIVSHISYSHHLHQRPTFTLSEAALGIGRISLLASAIVVVSPSLLSPLLPFGVSTDETLQLLEAVSQSDNDRVLVKVEGANCCIIAEGKEADDLVSKIENTEEEKEKIELYILALRSEVYPLKAVGETHAVREFEQVSKWMNEYKEFRRAISEETNRSNQGLEGLSDILSFLDIAANVIEVGVAAGTVSLWLFRKLLGRRQRSSNPFIARYIEQAESVLDFFEKVPKARITEISEGTGLPKQNLLPFLKSLSFEHEPACYWHPPKVQQELLKPALARAERKKKLRTITTIVTKLFLITIVIGGMVFVTESGLNATLLSFLWLTAFLLVLFIIAK